MPLFVISFEYLAKPLMNFGTLAIFVEICLFLLNLPFSYYNRHLWRFPSLSLQLRFCQTFNGSCPILPFLKFAIFAKIAIFCQTFTCNESFAKFANFAKYVIFVKPTIIDMPLLSSCLHFCQTCHFYKIVICQDAPFCHLICIWPNSWTLRFCRNLPFSPKFAIFL